MTGAELIHEQPALFSCEEVDLRDVVKPQCARRYTAESLQRNLAKRQAIIAALAEGHGLLRIARAFGVSHHLVAALRDSEPELVAIEKEQLSRSIGRVLRVCIERFEDGVVEGKVHPSQLPVGFGILSDKKALLDGEATQRVEHVERQVVTLELVAGYLAKKGISLPVVDLESNVLPAKPQENQPDRTQDSTIGCTALPAQAAVATQAGDLAAAVIGDQQRGAGQADGELGGDGGGGGRRARGVRKCRSIRSRKFWSQKTNEFAQHLSDASGPGRFSVRREPRASATRLEQGRDAAGSKNATRARRFPRL